MADKDQLPHLLKLLDDDCPEVRETVWQELVAYGPALKGLLVEYADLSPARRQEIVGEAQHRRLLAATAEKTAAGPLWQPGQLVRHQRYGYRGVVVSVDESCRADREWYERNRTQPDREQPWYHVLVDHSTQVTYAAQSSLEPDRSGRPVLHPLAPLYFEAFARGRYRRNQRPWEGEWSD